MRIPFKKLRKRSDGSTAIEFAIAAPVLLLLIFGLLQLGIMFFADAGLQHAVDEGARLATIYPRKTENDIKARVTGTQYGLQPARITGPSIVYGQVDGTDYAEVSMSYAMPVDFVFYRKPDMLITKTRRAYLP